MAMQDKKPVTVVPYVKNGVSYTATFAGYLSESEIERQMLFTRRVGKNAINFKSVARRAS